MAESLGVSGEVVVTEENMKDLELSVALEFTPVRVKATLDRSARKRAFQSQPLQATIDGNEIVVTLPRIFCRAGDKVCWQAYQS